MPDKTSGSAPVKGDMRRPVAPARGRPRVFDIENALKVAMRIFWERGYTQTTITDICQEIGIKPASFYHAFGSKEELFLILLDYYLETYWNNINDSFASEPDIYIAVNKLFTSAIKVYMRPNLPKGCFIDISTVGLTENEVRIKEALSEIQANGRNNIRKRLLTAIKAGQIPPDCDVPAITNALYTFLKGISMVARDNMCQAELNQIANLGVSLLPPRI